MTNATASVSAKGSSFQQKIQLISKEFFDIRSNKDSKRSDIDKAFTKFYNSLDKLVFNISIKVLRDRDLADENVSKVFMKIYQNTDLVFDESKSFMSYIWTVTHNSALMTFNKMKKDKLIPESRLKRNVTDGEEVENLLDIIYNKNQGDFETIDFDFAYLHNSNEKRYDKVVESIMKLSDGKPDVIIDALINKEENYDKIALKHGLKTAGAVKTRVFRAKNVIRRDLEKDIMTEKLQDGERVNGEVKLYYRNSRFQQVKYVATLKDSRLNGKFTKYHLNGIVAVEGNHLDGKLSGDYKEFYMNGNLKCAGSYKNGIKDSEWKRYNEDGSFDRRNDYINGEVAFYEFMNQNGELQSGIIDDRLVSELEEPQAV